MSHLFKILKSKDQYASISGPAVIVKNVSGGPFEVDAEGRTLSHNVVAAIDDSCHICKKGIQEGKLFVLKEIKNSAPKQKAKSEQKEEVKVEQPAVSSDDSVVASTEQNSSVQ